MKLIMISPKNRSVYNFRGDLIREIVRSGCEVVVTGPNQENIDKITELGVRFVEIPMDKNGVNPFADLQYQRTLYELFCREKPDVTFEYTAKPVIYGAIAAKKAGVPHIVSMVTGVGYAFTAKTAKAKAVKAVMSLLYKRAFSCADTVIFQNPDDRDQFVADRLLRADKCHVVNGSGVNRAKFPEAPYPEQITFFMLARVMYSKGIREYLEACKIVKEKRPEVRCMLLGACEQIQDSLSRDDLQPYIDGGILEYFGETNTVADYYRQCSVFVLPSYREGTSRAVLEAMSMARPIITTDAPGCRGTVIDGKTGFLVPVGDAQAVAEKMLTFVEHPEMIPEMGAASAALCEEKFDVRKVNADMCKYLGIKGEN